MNSIVQNLSYLGVTPRGARPAASIDLSVDLLFSRVNGKCASIQSRNLNPANVSCSVVSADCFLRQEFPKSRYVRVRYRIKFWYLEADLDLEASDF